MKRILTLVLLIAGLASGAWAQSATAKGNTSLIVWSPGSVEPHNRNLAPGDTERFIGLGPACRTKEGAITLSPGQSHELVFEMAVGN